MTQPVKHPGSLAMAGGGIGLLARAYFRVKPWLPKGLRWALRRRQVSRIIRRHSDTWPIRRTAAEKPPGWTGWPEDKQFALVFTHDVESAEGLAKVRPLAEMEMRHGLRSSFNFIPEGPYEDPVELRHWLVGNGFEVGVHDLNHDGQLYQSRESFSKKAESINRYLREWGAVGFRSGFMLHQLDWLHDLDISYDASTFDTDPFEPQPEGSDTIFPFLVKPEGAEAPSSSGYVELSYTLPQDSTLFLHLGEKTPAIWRRKLAWIRRNGGLALVNIHPDYISFGGGKCPPHAYPAELLKEFIESVCSEHEGMFWNPLARDLASWYRGRRPSPGDRAG